MMLGIRVKRKSVGLDDQLLNLSRGEFRQLLEDHDNRQLGTMRWLA